MYSVWSSSSFGVMVSQWSCRYWVIFPRPFPCRKMSFVLSRISSSSSSSSDDDSTSKKLPQLGYDPSEDLFGLAADFQPRGTGYTPCTECGIERPRQDCSLCNGKGIVTCNRCNGDCVIWEESIDERPWEKARSVSPLKVKEDDEVDNLDIKLDVRRKTKRVYQSPSAEVNLKISRSLKSRNAKTGIFSKRMKIIHKDPVLHAQRVAAIKKTKGTDSARKHASETMKNYFSDPENRRKRSISMKEINFYCRSCGTKGHRSNYCPEIQIKVTDRRFRCRMCGERGHNRRTCPESKSNGERKNKTVHRNHHCKKCGQSGHNQRTCPRLASNVASSSEGQTVSTNNYACSLCREKGQHKNLSPLSCLNISLGPSSLPPTKSCCTFFSGVRNHVAPFISLL